MSHLSKFSLYLYRGLIGLAVGGVCGGLIGAAALGFAAWLRENPEEPAWIFAGAVVGLMYGIICGAVLGFLIGAFSVWKVASDMLFLKSTKLR